jgi:CheY-like chemotaxis protein
MTQTILLVEDDPISQLSLQFAIEKASVGIAITAVDNGIQAKYYLEGKGSYSNRNSYPFPVAILTDVNMPCMSGIELLTWIKRNPKLQHIPVMVMSSSEEPEQVQLALESGATYYFSKLSPLDNLISQVKSLSLNLACH